MITSRPCLAIWSSACGMLLAWAAGAFSDSWPVATLVLAAVLVPALVFGLSPHVWSHLATGLLAILVISAASMLINTPAAAMGLVLFPLSGALYINWYANRPAIVVAGMSQD
jgi:hypothetical protein